MSAMGKGIYEMSQNMKRMMDEITELKKGYRRRSPSPMTDKKCFRCGGNHLVRDCPQPPNTPTRNADTGKGRRNVSFVQTEEQEQDTLNEEGSGEEA